MRIRNEARTLALATFVLALAASSLAGAPKSEQSRVTTLGEYMVQYDGSAVRAVVSDKLAAHSLGAPWLILEFGVVGKGMGWVPIERSSFFVIPPEGGKVAILSEGEFQDKFQAIRAIGRKAGYGQPLGEHFPAATRECNLAFFAGPDSALEALPLESVNVARVCMGPLFFRPPNGVTKGKWTLIFDAGGSTIRIPFTL